MMFSFGSMLAVLLFVSGLVFLLFKKNSSSSSSQLTPQVSIQTVHTNILKEIKSVKELSTVRIKFDSTIDFSRNKQIFGKDIPFSEQKLVLSYTGHIVCGCDLDQINISQSFFNGNHLVITLPNSKIFDKYADTETFKIHAKKSQLLADEVDLELQNKLVADDIKKKCDEYIEDGILLKSNENIRQILNSIVTPMGIIAEVNFVDNNSLPPSTPPLLTE